MYANWYAESSAVVKDNYECILPDGQMWFDFDHDFLYVDWGRRYHGLTYRPEHFMPTLAADLVVYKYRHPVIGEHVAEKVKNLALLVRDSEWSSEHMRVLKDAIKVFTGVKVLVLADQLHDRTEFAEELVWLRGELGNEITEASEWEKEQRYWDLLRNLELWIDTTQYALCANFTEAMLQEVWGNGHAMPHIMKKSITSATTKRKLLDICGDEDGFAKLEALNWEFATGDGQYNGDLTWHQQISYLEVVIDRISVVPFINEQGISIESPYMMDIRDLKAKCHNLRRKWEMEEQVLREAEGIMEK